MNKLVSSKDIAKLASVSQSTVSRALNNPEMVSENTRKKIMKIVKQLNYRPNSIARSLVSNKTKTIALISGPLHNPFFSESTTSIIDYAKLRDYNVNVYFERDKSNIEVYNSVLSNTVDGIILSSIYYEDEIFNELKKMNIPVVMFNRRHKEKGNFIEMDNRKAGRQATEHLIELGHRNILWMGGSIEMSTFYGRLQGYKDALINNQISIEQRNILITNTDEKSVFEKLDQIMSRKDKPTAINAATDSIAIFVIDYLQKRKYNVPDDISVIGIDNVRISGHSSFQLSSISITSQKNLGRIAVETLFKLIDKVSLNKEEVNVTVDTELVVRKTTKRLI